MLLLSEEQPNKLASRSCGEERFSGSEDEYEEVEELETMVRDGEVSTVSSSSSSKKKSRNSFSSTRKSTAKRVMDPVVVKVRNIPLHMYDI